MELIERVGNLFDVEEQFYVAYCVSMDAHFPKSLPREYKQKFDLAYLQKAAVGRRLNIGDCFSTGRTLNLVVKDKYNRKARYSHIEWSLEAMKHLCRKFNIKQIAMPRLGADDNLNWTRVNNLIFKVLGEEDIKIVVYSPPRREGA